MNTVFKLLATGMLGSALFYFTGCEQTVNDRAADSVRESSQETADDIRDTSQEAAEDLRDADGRTVLGGAETPSVEETADDIEEAGEARADAVEEAGEQRADEIEERDTP